ncbi:MAG: hypothetical protein AAGF12_15630, partial [Myxococcota bacterium]
ESWRPRFDYMTCDSLTDDNEDCDVATRDFAEDYESGELYHFSFVTQELLSPGEVMDPFSGRMTQWCTSIFGDAPNCTSHAAFVRTSFLKVSDTREYVPTNWVDERFDRAGYFRNERQTWDRSLDVNDPAYFGTDFLNYNLNRHNIWRDWYEDGDGPVEDRPTPYADRRVRQIVWYSTTDMPAHLMKPNFEIAGTWNEVLMQTVRNARNEPVPRYARQACQVADPDAYCYCQLDAAGNSVLPDTNGDGIGDCAGRYDVFETPDDARNRLVSGEPYDCHVQIPSGAEPNYNDDLVARSLSDETYNDWFDAEFVGSECVNILRSNTCNMKSIAEAEAVDDEGVTLRELMLNCQERGDARFKFMSYVSQPGTGFLGIATLRGDPVTGEIIVGDANIGGPALDSYRTSALQQYDVLNGNLTDEEILTGEDVRSYLETTNSVQLPAPPRVDFSTLNVAGNAAPDELTQIDQHMDRIMERVERLQGPEGRNAVYSDRLQMLAGTEIERRLMENMETYALAGYSRLPRNTTGADVTETILDQVSPFRISATERLNRFDELERDVASANVLMPNEYVDDSVTHFVTERQGWQRARLEFELNRMLYWETQLHEMGHCMGLRHQFHGSSDSNQYGDDYYYINEQIPIPDARDFDLDGTPGLSSTEQSAFEEAYGEARSQRELAGIDRWMNSSTMEYMPEWYERSRQGRYDYHAIGLGYGDIVEVYDNQSGIAVEDINPTNTPRIFARYYQGGEPCQTDAECPYSESGSRAADLIDGNRASGLIQSCGPRADDLSASICSNFTDDSAALLGEPGVAVTPTHTPVEYKFCTDERATGLTSNIGSIGNCNRFDEGASYREIVQNIADRYDRMYLWTNFRRYRSSYDIGGYIFNQLIARRLIILQNIWNNLAFRYTTEPEFRNEEGAFGFYDQFFASADIVNFYSRILAQPNVGGYRWNEQWERYERSDIDPNRPGLQLSVPMGLGRYFSSIYQSGLTGIYRVERTGTFYDKQFVLQLMTDRGSQSTYLRDTPLYINLYDLFPEEMQQLFGGMVRDEPRQYMPRMICDQSAGARDFPNCDNPQVQYMDIYRGNCEPGSTTCRPDPVEVTYRDLPVLNGGSSIILQIYATIFGLAQFPTFYDSTFQNQLYVCREGAGDCTVPGPEAEEGVDFVRYTSERYAQSFISYQVEPTSITTNQTSIGFDLVREARDLSFILRMLQKFRGDLGGAPYVLANLTPEERAQLAALQYELPTDANTVTTEEERIFGRILDLESFFNQLIQLQRQFGIFR